MKKVADLDKIFKSVESPYRTMMERVWFRNILYYIGEQWIVWGAGNSFEYMYKLTEDIPTPVSDIIKDHVKSMKALIVNKKFSMRVSPNSNEQSDKDAARLGSKAAEWLKFRNDAAEIDTMESVAIWTVLTGNGFCRTYPNPNTGKFVLGANNKPVVSKGDVATKMFLPFNVLVPNTGETVNEKRYVGMRYLVEREWAEDTYKRKFKTSKDQGRVVDYQRRLEVLVANVSPWKGQGIDTSSVENEDSILMEEVEFRPTLEYPKGRHIGRCCGEEIFDKDELPIKVAKDGSWEYTITHFPYDYTPGSFWAMSSVNSLISPQDTINKIDQAQETNRESIGRPYVITPSSLTLRRLSARGSKLLALEYDAAESMTQKPEVQPGTPYPPAIFEDRRNRLATAQQTGGDPKNILSGSAPYAGAPGVAIDILQQSAEKSHTPDIDRFYRRWGSVKRKQLVIVQSLYTESRLLKVPGSGNEMFVRRFKGSDLHNNTDVRMELDSGLSSTNAGTVSILMDSIQYGLWNDEMVRPDLRHELLPRMGLSGIQEQGNIHMERAEYENGVLAENNPKGMAKMALPSEEKEGPPIQDAGGETLSAPSKGNDPVFRLDNHSIHITIHDKFIFSREFMDLSAEVQKNAIGHRDLHASAMVEQEEAASQIAISEEIEKDTGGPDDTNQGLDTVPAQTQI